MTIEQARGLMIGGAVGDCIGARFEGFEHVGEADIRQLLTDPPVLTYTDDTAMAISVAESLLFSGGFEGHDMAMRFARGWRADPYRGYGGAVQGVFRDLLAGISWEKAAGGPFGGVGSFGNGAAMRVAPTAVWASDLDECVQLARDTARITHTHPAGVDGAVVQAAAAWNALHGDKHDLVDLIGSLVESDEFKVKVELLATGLQRGDADWVRRYLGNGVAASYSVLTAQWCHLSSRSFEETILNALRIGGDTDTIAAMAGAVAGARYGYDSIPELWRNVEAADRLIELADRMWAGRGEGPA